jgi:phosphodiesterase/alkaline phosphatase D-like protein
MSAFDKYVICAPLVGAVTDTSALVNVSLLPQVKNASIVVAKGAAPSLANPWITPSATLLDRHPTKKYRVIQFRLDGLEPASPYVYSLVLDGELSDVGTGSFRTFPREAEPADVAFALASCCENTDVDVFGAIDVDPSEPLFFLHMGDLQYWNPKDDTVGERIEYLREAMSVPSENGYRRTALAQMLRSRGLAYVWDDHDFVDDDTGGASNRHEDRTADGDYGLRRLAKDAYDRFFPHYPFTPANDGISQAFWVGAVRVLVADSRYNQTGYATKPLLGHREMHYNELEERRILSANQMEWIRAELADNDASADVFVLVLTFPWISDAESRNNWGDYGAQRAQLAGIIGPYHDRLFIVSGDAHSLAIDDGSHSAGGVPVFHAAALDHKPSQKGGPYSKGAEGGVQGGKQGDGVDKRAQYGTFVVTYPKDAHGNPTGQPSVRLVGRRLEGNTTKDVIWHTFP